MLSEIRRLSRWLIHCFLFKCTPLTKNPSEALRELLLDHTDRIIEGAVIRLQKKDSEFINQLQAYAREHPEDACVVEKILQALDVSESGIEIHISYE